jgi:hypothetical protein
MYGSDRERGGSGGIGVFGDSPPEILRHSLNIYSEPSAQKILIGILFEEDVETGGQFGQLTL